MASGLDFTLNGRSMHLADCPPNTTLLDYLRGIGLTGSKEGCAEGDCGACSVAIIDRDSQGKACYRAINSCLVPVCLLAGREIVSVEGVACGRKLHPVQQKMVECHGSQCGYCTPGFIMSLFEGYYRGDIRKSDQLDDQLSGNLCRCTGYRPIREAAIEAFPKRHGKNGADAFAERIKKADPKLSAVEYTFGQENFFRPTSLTDLLQVAAQFPDARLIAGATELGLDISKRFQKFSTLISVEAVPELKEITSTDSEWHIGAAVTLTQIEEQMANEFPALGRMLRVFGSRQIRNRATMGGNLVTASPIADSAPVLLALDAKLVLVSLGSSGSHVSPSLSERTMPIDQFFVSYRKTALKPGEILKTIIVPRFPAGNGVTRKCQWYKVSKRREMDISTVAACFTVDLDRRSILRQARLAYGGVAAMPARALRTEKALLGKPWTSQTIQEVLPILKSEFTPISDVRGSAEYRRGLVTSLFEQFHGEAAADVKRLNEKGPNLITQASTKVTKRPLPHESGHKHVTGEAMYVDDDAAVKPMLEVWPVCSPHARAKIIKRDATAARAMPGIRAVLLAEDIPGLNDAGTKQDEVLLPDKEVSYHGQIVALVVGDSPEACRAAAVKVVVDYEPLPPVLTLEP